jgi:hypothetical protein
LNGAVRERLRLLGTGLLLVLTTRLCYLVLRYQGPDGVVTRPHLESAALLLAAAGLAVRFATDRPILPAASPTRLALIVWPALAAGALALYWPALRVGLLSDDFILFQHAQAWDVSQVAPQLFRPLPIFVWAIVVHLGGGAAALVDSFTWVRKTSVGEDQNSSSCYTPEGRTSHSNLLILR